MSERADDDVVEQVLALAADRPDLAVTADLTVTVAGVDVRVSSYTDLLRVEFPTVRGAVRVARSGRGFLGRLGDALAATGLTAAVHVGRTRVATLGAEARPGPLGRRLGRVEVRPGGALRAVLTAL